MKHNTQPMTAVEFRKIDTTKKKPEAKKVFDPEYNITFPSTTEHMLFKLLKRIKIDFEYQVRFDIFDTTYPKNKKVLLLQGSCASAVKIIVDFVFRLGNTTYIVDSKGSKASTSDYAYLKYNLLKHRIIEQGEQNETQIKFMYYSDISRISKMCIGMDARKIFINEFFKIKPL